MRTALHGQIDRPAVAVVGVWDPFLAKHEQLCRELATAARERSLASLAIVLHPNPPALINGDRDFPPYDGLQTRVWRLRNCGLDAVLKLQMTRADADRGAAAFFDAVLAAVPLAELWLGPSQTLGRGPPGSQRAIVEFGAQQRVRVRVLPRPPAEGANGTYLAMKLLAEGRLAQAIECVGHPPVWKQPRSGVLRLPWRPGRYRVAPLSHPGAWDGGPDVTVPLWPRADGNPAIDWPDRRARYLAFLDRLHDDDSAPATVG